MPCFYRIFNMGGRISIDNSFSVGLGTFAASIDDSGFEIRLGSLCVLSMIINKWANLLSKANFGGTPSTRSIPLLIIVMIYGRGSQIGFSKSSRKCLLLSWRLSIVEAVTNSAVALDLHSLLVNGRSNFISIVFEIAMPGLISNGFPIGKLLNRSF